MLTKVTVIGGGAMATVTALVLASNDIHVALLMRRPERAAELLTTRENRAYLPGVRLPQRIVPTADARAAMDNAELIISAVPCQYLSATWESLAPVTPADVPICSVTKGIDAATLRRPSELIARWLDGNPLAVLSGPCIAAEVARCLPATVVTASDSLAVAKLVQTALTASWFRVYTNPDMAGVELAGALKNVIALAAGILDGLHAGDNAKAALLTRGLVEITRLGIAMGARPATFAGLAGVGDLITTCVSPHGRNRSAGERIGSGVPVETVLRESRSVIEGIPTARAVLALAQRYGVDMPITQSVYTVVFERKNALEAISELMNRPLKGEEVC